MGTQDCSPAAGGEKGFITLRGESRGFSPAGRKLGVPLELQQGLREPLMLPQWSQVSFRVARAAQDYSQIIAGESSLILN